MCGSKLGHSSRDRTCQRSASGTSTKGREAEGKHWVERLKRGTEGTKVTRVTRVKTTCDIRVIREDRSMALNRPGWLPKIDLGGRSE